jgi:hypothetical protein
MPVTVTVWGVDQFPDVNTSEPTFACASPGADDETAIVTFAVGWVASTTAK